MKMTYAKFMDLLQQDAKQRQTLQEEIAGLMEESAKIEADMKTVAAAGNDERYLELSEKKDTIEKRLYVKRTFQDKRSPLVNEAGALEAWSDYIGSYNKRLKTAIADFEAEKQKLCAMYSDLVGLQKNACEAREKIADAVGMDASSFKMETIPFVEYISGPDSDSFHYSMKLNGLMGVADPDVCYYLSNHVKRSGEKIAVYSAADMENHSPEADRVVNVVIKQRSK